MINKTFSLIKRKYLLIFLLVVVIFTFARVYSESVPDSNSLILNVGKNEVIFNLTENFYVKDLVRWNPTISVVSYTKGNKTLGYVNLFSGIGENFIIESNRSYEMIVDKNISLVLPFGTAYIIEEG